MSLKFPKRYYLIFALLALISALAIYWITQRIIQEEKETRASKLEQVNKNAASELKEALSNYVTLISGIRAETKFSKEFPTQEKLFNFIRYQISDLNIDKSFVISYVDTTHRFRYSFTQDKINPTNMIGKRMQEIVGNKGVANLSRMMKKDAFYAFDPFNLVEGRVGLPIGFGVLNNEGRSLGYFSIVTDFKPIVDAVYSNVDLNEFVFKFSNSRDIEFDREKVYDGNTIYNTESDAEYYANFDIAANAYIATTIPFYNKSFTISTAYKNTYKYSASMFLSLGLWYLAILGFLFFVISQLYLYQRKNKLIAAQKQQLSQLVATKNKFFSIIAHDLRSPLSSVVNFLDVLKEEEFKNVQTNQIVKALEDSSRNSITLLDNLLKWSKVQTGNLKFNPEPLDSLSLVKDQVRVQNDIAQKKGIKVIVESAVSEKLVADKNMLATTVRNLLSNALKFSKEGGIIVIELSSTEDTFAFSIEDNGIGIPADFVKKIFDMTQITTQTGTHNEKGSGLGLLLCKQFIEMHGGKIAVESTVNKGTIVSFTLPI